MEPQESRVPEYRLNKMTWPEIASARASAPLAIIPVGSCEQHGPALTLETDTVRADGFASILAERLSPLAVVTPTLSIGISEHHMGFPGTLTLAPSTFIAMVFDVVESLVRHGWRRIFVLTGHGGNDAALGVLTTRIQREIPELSFAWSGISPLITDLSTQNAQSRIKGHSCELETSQTLYLSPSSVRIDRLEEGASDLDKLSDIASLSRSHKGVHYSLPYDRLSANGALGDPRLANIELGKLLIETAAERLTAFLFEFAQRNPAPKVAQIDQAGGVQMETTK